MNKWQKKYCEVYYNGKTPNTKIGKEEFKYLEVVKESVTVYLPSGTRTYKVTIDKCDMPNGFIDVCTLASNIRFWLFRGFKVSTQ